jgi:hypothetical protein
VRYYSAIRIHKGVYLQGRSGVLGTIALVFTSALYVGNSDLLQTSFFSPAFAQGRLSLQITVFAEPAAHGNLPPSATSP